MAQLHLGVGLWLLALQQQQQLLLLLLLLLPVELARLCPPLQSQGVRELLLLPCRHLSSQQSSPLLQPTHQSLPALQPLPALQCQPQQQQQPLPLQLLPLLPAHPACLQWP